MRGNGAGTGASWGAIAGSGVRIDENVIVASCDGTLPRPGNRSIEHTTLRCHNRGRCTFARLTADGHPYFPITLATSLSFASISTGRLAYRGAGSVS